MWGKEKNDGKTLRIFTVAVHYHHPFLWRLHIVMEFRYFSAPPKVKHMAQMAVCDVQKYLFHVDGSSDSQWVCVCFRFEWERSSKIVIYFSHWINALSPRTIYATTFIYETFFMFLLKRNIMIKWNYLLHQFLEMLFDDVWQEFFTRICFLHDSSDLNISCVL